MVTRQKKDGMSSWADSADPLSRGGTRRQPAAALPWGPVSAESAIEWSSAQPPSRMGRAMAAKLSCKPRHSRRVPARRYNFCPPCQVAVDLDDIFGTDGRLWYGEDNPKRFQLISERRGVGCKRALSCCSGFHV
jgi:hypothetical protein